MAAQHQEKRVVAPSCVFLHPPYKVQGAAGCSGRSQLHPKVRVQSLHLMQSLAPGARLLYLT